MESEEVPFQQHIREFPDRVLSYIFSKLSLKDLVKTSKLSKQRLDKYQELREDLNFDLQNVFDNTTLELPKTLRHFKRIQSQFAKRVDQLMFHCEDSLIRSLRVNFPLGDKQSDVIRRLISQGIAKGVERIELLFSFETSNFHDFRLRINPYKFPFTLLSGADSLKHLHLENCLIILSMKLSRIKNLRALVLHLVVVERDMLPSLLSNCIHLVDLTLDECVFQFELNITSPTLCHLNILKYSNDWRRIDIIAPNLSSFDYSSSRCEDIHSINIMADKLSKFRYQYSDMSEAIGYYVLKNVTTIVLHGLTEWLDWIVPVLFSECLQLEDVTFKRCTIEFEVKIIGPMLRHLNIIDCGSSFPFPEIHIDALNLSSFEYSCPMMISYIDAPKLLKVLWNATNKGRRRWPFDMIATLHELETFTMIMSYSKIAILPKVWGPFQNLRELNFFIEGTYDPHIDYFWILDIAMVSPRLQNLSLTIRNSHLDNSHVTLQRQRKEYMGFSHSELKCVELRGCVGTINVIELAKHLLRNVSSLKQITFSSRDRFYRGVERWTDSSGSCCCFESDLIR